MQCLGLEGPDSRVIELPSHVPRDIEDPQPYDLVGHATGH